MKNFTVCGLQTVIRDWSTVINFLELLRQFMGFVPIPGKSREPQNQLSNGMCSLPLSCFDLFYAVPSKQACSHGGRGVAAPLCGPCLSIAPPCSFCCPRTGVAERLFMRKLPSVSGRASFPHDTVKDPYLRPCRATASQHKSYCPSQTNKAILSRILHKSFGAQYQ